MSNNNKNYTLMDAKKAEEILKIFPQNIYNNALVDITKFVFTRSN